MRPSRFSIGLITAVLATAFFATAVGAREKPRVLVYSGSTGYRHQSIPAAVAALRSIGEKAGYSVDATEDPEVFSAEKLAPYKALILVSTSTDPKNPDSEWFQGSKRDALQGFLKAGKGVIGLHAAADSHYNWGLYGQMIGGYFDHHPKGTPKGVVTVVDAKHPATAKLPKTLERHDEWYYYKDFDPTMLVLITIDPATIGDSGEADVNPNPLVWCHNFGGGRVFYSALGHTDESWSEPYMVNLMTGALAYAVGK